MDIWDDMSDDDYEEELKHLMNLRQEIVDPLSTEDIAEFIDFWASKHLGFIRVEAEKYFLGEDEDGYIILGHLTPNENNPNNSHFYITRCDDYKRRRKMKYKIEFISAFDEINEDDDDAYLDIICFTNNLFNAIENMVIYWKDFLTQIDN